MRSLKAEEKWAGDPIKAALTPEALTACLSPRWALLQIIRRSLSHAFGWRDQSSNLLSLLRSFSMDCLFSAMSSSSVSSVGRSFLGTSFDMLGRPSR